MGTWILYVDIRKEKSYNIKSNKPTNTSLKEVFLSETNDVVFN